MVLIKVMKHKEGTVVAICDKNALGKVYRDEKYCLDLIRYRNFYEGEDAKTLDVKEVLKSASSINAVGARSIKMLKENGFDVSNVKRIGKERIEHLQVYLL